MQIYSKSDAHAIEKDDIGDVKVSGRNLLDVWRIMRHEAGEIFSISFKITLYFFLFKKI